MAEHETVFKASCKQWMETMKEKMRRLEGAANGDESELAQILAIEVQFNADYERLQKIRKLLSKKKRVRYLLLFVFVPSCLCFLVCAFLLPIYLLFLARSC